MKLFSPHFNGHFPGRPGLARTEFIWMISTGDEGSGNNLSYKTCKAPVISSPPTNQHQVFFCRPELPFMFVKHDKMQNGTKTYFRHIPCHYWHLKTENFITAEISSKPKFAKLNNCQHISVDLQHIFRHISHIHN